MLIEILCQKLIGFNIILAFLNHLKPIFFLPIMVVDTEDPPPPPRVFRISAFAPVSKP